MNTKYLYFVERLLLADIIQWDIENWSKALPFWEPFLPAGEGLKVGAFGEREGGLSLWLAQKGFQVECSDFNADMAPAQELHKKHEVDHLVSYSKQDITQSTFEDNHFDVVLFKSVIGALGDKDRQEKAFKELYRVLKPGGLLIFAENTVATKMHEFARKKFNNWGDRWRYIKIDETKEMLSDFSDMKFKSQGLMATFGRNEGQRRAITKMGKPVSKLVPNNWNYILFGACVK
ncbi:MAG: methyltransferase domain-containing protein [Flavobacteriales bacterium]|nr:methyltransferase domain-containing protein [Flavobacteriales bacterium]